MEGPPGPDMEFLMQNHENVRAHMRFAVMQTIQGFSFADEGAGSPDSAAEETVALRADRAAAAESTEGWDEVLSVGLEASTTDHPDQSIGTFEPHI